MIEVELEHVGLVIPHIFAKTLDDLTETTHGLLYLSAVQFVKSLLKSFLNVYKKLSLLYNVPAAWFECCLYVLWRQQVQFRYSWSAWDRPGAHVMYLKISVRLLLLPSQSLIMISFVAI